MMFPDCRNDDYYNDDFLSEEDAAIVDGYDYCVENAVNSAFENIDAFPPEDLDMSPSDVVRVLHAFREWISSYIESERDEMITSMIDDMDDAEYQKQRNQAIEDNGKEKYYDTRHYACTGVKLFRDGITKAGSETESDAQ